MKVSMLEWKIGGCSLFEGDFLFSKWVSKSFNFLAREVLLLEAAFVLFF